MKKVIIAGGRDFNNYTFLKSVLEAHFSEPIIVVSGGAQGADSLGERYANEKGYEVERHPANWKDINAKPCSIKYNQYGAYNALAGHNRNREMLNSIIENEDGGEVITFWNGVSKGTENMIKISKEASIKTTVIYY